MSTDLRMATARRLYRLLRRADGAAAVSILAAALVDAYEDGRRDGRADGEAEHNARCVHRDTLSRLTALEHRVFGGGGGR